MKLPKRQSETGYVRPPRESFTAVRDVASALAETPAAQAEKRKQRKAKKKAKADAERRESVSGGRASA